VKINYGIKTGFNEAFIIDRAKKDELIAADPKSAEIIRPILRGRDIKRYTYEFADLWLIATHNGIREKGIPPVNVKKYPAIKAHLDQFYAALEKRFDKGDTPYNLRSCAYTDDFSKQKIVWGEISDIPKFSFDADGKFLTDVTTFIMTGESLGFLMCFLNSRLSEYYFSKIGTTTGVGTVRWKKYKIETFHIPKLTNKEQIPFAMILNKILSQKQKSLNTTTLEKDADTMIYRLFEFSEEEIQTIEG